MLYSANKSDPFPAALTRMIREAMLSVLDRMLKVSPALLSGAAAGYHDLTPVSMLLPQR